MPATFSGAEASPDPAQVAADVAAHLERGARVGGRAGRSRTARDPRRRPRCASRSRRRTRPPRGPRGGGGWCLAGHGAGIVARPCRTERRGKPDGGAAGAPAGLRLARPAAGPGDGAARDVRDRHGAGAASDADEFGVYGLLSSLAGYLLVVQNSAASAARAQHGGGARTTPGRTGRSPRPCASTRPRGDHGHADRRCRLRARRRRSTSPSELERRRGWARCCLAL